MGEELKKGDTIRLIVSKGPELKEFAMPDFVGKQLEIVQEQLINVWHLTCNPATDIEMVYSDKPGGEIVWQSIPETTLVKEWDTIQFQVSSGLAATPKLITFQLPQDEREKVLLQIYVGDETSPQYSGSLYCSDEFAEVPLTGNGTQLVKVYIDGVLDQYQTHYMQFN